MSRSMWSGDVSCGLLNVGVKMFNATSDRAIRSHRINTATGHRVRQQMVDAETGETATEMVAGYEIAPEKYVTIADAELDALAPERTHKIALEAFVSASEVPSRAEAALYWLGPDKGADGAYRLLVAAMTERGVVGVGRVIMRSRERLVVVGPQDGVLTARVLAWADEVNEAPEVKPGDVPARELEAATTLIDAMTGEFDHAAYVDEHRQRLTALIEAKAACEPTPEARDAAQAPDLMAALKASLVAVREPEAAAA